MKKLNKLFLAAGSVAAIAAPVAAVVSCGTTSSSLPEYKETTYKVDASRVSNGKVATLFGATDGGSRLDGSFNEQALDAIAELSGVAGKNSANFINSSSSSASNIIAAYNQAISKNASMIVGAGFMHSTPMQQVANKNTSTAFVIVDSTVDANKDGKTVQQGNVASLLFKAEQGGFLAGMEAAKYALAHPVAGKQPTVATFGGMPIKAVTDYMDGFKGGVDAFNKTQDQAHQVKLLGTSNDFIGSFEPDPDKIVTTKTNSFIEQGATVIFPVGGSQEYTVLKAVTDSNKADVKVIGVDTDMVKSVEASTTISDKDAEKAHILGSALKEVKASIETAVKAIYEIDATTELPGHLRGAAALGHVYVGDIHDGWVGFVSYASGSEQKAAGNDLTTASSFVLPSKSFFSK